MNSCVEGYEKWSEGSLRGFESKGKLNETATRMCPSDAITKYRQVGERNTSLLCIRVRCKLDQVYFVCLFVCVSITVRLLELGQLEEDYPITTFFFENRRFSSFFSNGPTKIQDSREAFVFEKRNCIIFFQVSRFEQSHCNIHSMSPWNFHSFLTQTFDSLFQAIVEYQPHALGLLVFRYGERRPWGRG